MPFEATLHAIVKAKYKPESDPHVSEKSDILVLRDQIKLVKEEVVDIFIKFDASQGEIDKINVATSTKIGSILNGATAK